MAFPTTPLAVQVDLQLGGTWIDVTSDVRLGDRIHIERGRHDEGSRVDPAKCTLTLDNRSGKYSPRNPVSPYYGLLGRNTPIRVSVPGASAYLDVPGTTGGRATTPDAPVLRITGDLDVRVDLDGLWSLPIDEQYHEVISRYDNSTGEQRSWRLMVGNAFLFLEWSADGTGATFRSIGSTQAVQPTQAGRMALRATLDVDNGTGGHTVRFYTAASTSGPWTQLGDAVVTAGATSIHPGTAPLVIGDNTLVPAVSTLPLHVLRAEVRAGIDGSAVATPDFTVQAPGASSFSDSSGRTWTIADGAEITNRVARFIGEVAAWPPRRDVSGTDVFVPVQAAGIMRRLGQGAAPLQSTLRRSIPSGQPLAYWPLEDERGASQAYSPLPGVNPLEVTAIEFGADSDLAGSQPLPVLRTGARFHGVVPAPSTPLTVWQINFLYRAATVPAQTSRLLTWKTSGTAATWVLDVGALSGTSMHLYALDAAGNTVLDAVEPANLFAGGWHQMLIRVTQVGANLQFLVQWFAVGSQSSWSVSGTAPGTIGALTEIDTQLGDLLDGMALGHLAVFGSAADVYSHADNAFEGDRPNQRITRLCREEGVAALTLGEIDGEVALGAQRPATFLALLQEAAETDNGVLAEHRDSIALWYRPGYLTYNQRPTITLDFGAGDVAPPLELVDDDQAVRNDVTITRSGGSSARAVDTTSRLSVQMPPAGVGRYDEAVTLSLHRDGQLPDIAGWRLHLGTWDGARYPSVRLDLAAAPRLIPAALRIDLRDRITITGLPPADGPTTADLIVEGYTETLGLYDWDLTLNCSPAGGWNVAVLDDPVCGRADTSGSQLAAGATATATTLSIATTTGPLWSTDPAEYPVDVLIVGERVTITALTGTTSPQTATAVRSVNGVTKPLPAAADVRLWQPAITAL
ncbi:hypothetical protein [Streptomyces rubellomurinus]|uniref:Uncharacterized protein n=1 Tax=Streptomyces rubellomurinus (strain ATCC 31215) TaxID=359131 RepID=A0A0F2TBW6_STRR3|nr:hypothetical protein [Streptomyces rubellomurinus]KJS60654.1 hypothetical protein VM95_19725 [Streptomyces rubellomurinus]